MYMANAKCVLSHRNSNRQRQKITGKLWSLLPFAFHVNVMLKSLHHQVVKGKLTTVRLKICKLMFRALALR